MVVKYAKANLNFSLIVTLFFFLAAMPAEASVKSFCSKHPDRCSPSGTPKPDAFDGFYSGTIRCGSSGGDPGFTRETSIIIFKGEMPQVRSGYDNVKGAIEKEGGFFSSVGDITINGSYTYKSQRKPIRYSGEWAPELIRISGTRGPRNCSGELRRGISIAEQQKRQEEALAAARAARLKEEEAAAAEAARQEAEQKKKEEQAAELAAREEALKQEQEALRQQQKAAARQAEENEYLVLERRLSKVDKIHLQMALIDAGFLNGKADGIIGRGSRAAIRKYQTANGLEESGYLTQDHLTTLVDNGRQIAQFEADKKASRSTVVASTADNNQESIVGPEKNASNVGSNIASNDEPANRQPSESKTKRAASIEAPDDAKVYLGDIEKFVELYPTTLDVLVIARTYSRAVKEIEEQTHAEDGSNFLELVAHSQGSEHFQAFHKGENDRRMALRLAEKTRITEEITQDVAQVRDRLQKNPLAPEAYELSQIISTYGDIRGDRDLSELKALQLALNEHLKRVDTGKTPAAAEQSAVASATGAATQVSKNPSLKEPAVTANTKTTPSPASIEVSNSTEARIYLDDIKSFVSLNPSVLDPVVLAVSYTPALKEVEEKTFNRSGSRFLELFNYTKGVENFVAHHVSETKKRVLAKAETKAKLASDITAKVDLIETRLRADPLAPEAYSLGQLVTKYKTLPQNAETEQLAAIQKSLDDELSGLGITLDTNADEQNQAVAKDTEVITVADLEVFSSLGAEDIAILVNIGEDAPNAYLSLSGAFNFADKNANACAPSLEDLDRKFRTYFELEIRRALPDHNIIYQSSCETGLSGIDLLIVTGADLAKSQKIPSAPVLVSSVNDNKLKQLVSIHHSQFTAEAAKREIVSDQYTADIRDAARLGYGAIAFETEVPVACIILKEDVSPHDQSLLSASEFLRFHNGVEIREMPVLEANFAFRQAQKGQCALIYAAEDDLAKILSASQKANLAARVLPFWTNPATIEARANQLASLKSEKVQAEAQRRAQLEKEQTEKALRDEARRAQLEVRQSDYRLRHGAKVASYVSKITSEIGKSRDSVDKAISANRSAEAFIQSSDFWPAITQWYANKRLSGWEFESDVPAPKDYGTALWRNREVEIVVAEVRTLMKNRSLGEYSDTCWLIGYIYDAEFLVHREPFSASCDEPELLEQWKLQYDFKTQWDLGV